MPLPARNAGFRSDDAIASASTRVVITRLSLSSRAHFSECGLPSVGDPARLTTTSAASTRSRSIRPAYGSQVDWSVPRASPRVKDVTACPRPSRAPRNSVPRKPDAPARRTWATAGGTRSDLERACLEPPLHVLQEPSGVGAVHEPVVVGQGQVD